MKIKRLLIIEDDSTLKTALSRALNRFGYSVTTASSKAEALTWLSSQTLWDGILLDLQLPDGTGLELLDEVKKKLISIPVIVLTGHGSVENAIAATQKGAFNFLVKPINLDDIITNLNKALSNTEIKPTQMINEPLLSTRQTNSAIVGQSPAIHQVLDMVTRVAARIASDAGDNAKALDYLRWAAKNANNEGYLGLAKMRLVSQLIELGTEKDFAEADQILKEKPITGFNALWLERRGDWYLAQKKMDQAKASYQDAWKTVDQVKEFPEEARRLLKVKLDAVGGVAQ